MERWFISDTHWGHKNIIEYSQRPYASVEEMNEKLIQNWNAVVKPNDEVYHLGDVAFMKFTKFNEEVRPRLEGNIHIIRGNHDQMITKNTHVLLGTNIVSIQDYLELKVDQHMFVLFHFGQRVWNKSHHGSIHLFGHSHGTLPPHGKSVDVGVDCKEITSEYRPISMGEVLEYMKNRTFEVVDHHDSDTND